MTIRCALLPAFLAVLGTFALGCASTRALAPGRGLYWSYNETRLEQEGYPGHDENYESREWGILYDDDGIPYGPRTFYQGKTRLDHPYLNVTDEYVECRSVRIYQSECCTEALLGHFLEICDLAVHDLSRQLQYEPLQHEPKVQLEIYTPANIEDYRKISGHEYWVTHVVEGNAILLEPIDVLFRRTLAAKAAFASIAEALLDLKCGGRLPPWFREGLSSYLAREGYEHLNFMAEFRPRRSVLMSPDEVQRHVFPLVDRENGRIARYNAFLMVWYLSESYGWDRVQQLMKGVQEGLSFDEAVRGVYRMDLTDLLQLINPVLLGEPTTTLPPRR